MRQRNYPKIDKATADRGILMSYKDARDKRLSNPVEIGFLYGAIVLAIMVGTIAAFPTQWRDTFGLSGLMVALILGITYLLAGLIIIPVMRTPRGKRLRTFGIVVLALGSILGLGVLMNMVLWASVLRGTKVASIALLSFRSPPSPRLSIFLKHYLLIFNFVGYGLLSVFL